MKEILKDYLLSVRINKANQATGGCYLIHGRMKLNGYKEEWKLSLKWLNRTLNTGLVIYISNIKGFDGAGLI